MEVRKQLGLGRAVDKITGDPFVFLLDGVLRGDGAADPPLDGDIAFALIGAVLDVTVLGDYILTDV